MVCQVCDDEGCQGSGSFNRMLYCFGVVDNHSIPSIRVAESWPGRPVLFEKHGVIDVARCGAMPGSDRACSTRSYLERPAATAATWVPWPNGVLIPLQCFRDRGP